MRERQAIRWQQREAGSRRAAAPTLVRALAPLASLSVLAAGLVVVGAGTAAGESGSLSSGAGVGAGAAGGSAASALAAPPDPRNTDFYADFAPTEGEPGRVIRTEPAQLATEALGDALAAGGSGSADAAGAAGLRVAAERVVYESTDAAGAPLPTAGLYIRNDGAGPAGGGARPLAVLSPGTQGLGDQCAPSKTIPKILDVKLSPGISVGLGYEALQAQYFLARGFSVFVPDYEGVGMPGISATYMDRAAMAHASLDAARAASRVPDSGLGERPRTVLYGHSQGGGATAAAAELQPDYAPDIDLVAAAASGVPADLQAFLGGIDRNINAGLYGFVAAGLSATYPAEAGRIRAVFNDAGAAMLDRSAVSCIGDSIAGYAFADSRQWTTDGRTIAKNFAADPELSALLEEQRIGRGVPGVPVAVIQEPNDDVIPTPQVRRLAEDWCSGGAAVSYLEGFAPPILPSSGSVHMAAGLHPQGAEWLAARVAGKPAGNTCSA
ncbi:lipase family protein [Dietzia sp.]|uniref:lipase family protein n=1 Tax=Dietzia sp. TaxID=1871616 RepID=UPI002FDA269A